MSCGYPVFADFRTALILTTYVLLEWSLNYRTISVNYFAQSFKPNLPPEVIVEFSISRGELLVEAFYLLASQKETTNITEGYHPSRKNFIGCICVYHSQKVEIVDYGRALLPIPQLKEMFVLIDELIAKLVKVRNNVKALIDCHDCDDGHF